MLERISKSHLRLMLVVVGMLALLLLAGLPGKAWASVHADGTIPFGDVPPDHWAYTYINILSANGITSGCAINPPDFCPNDPATRAQMAVFLLRGIHGGAYSPPPATGAVFADVPVTHWAAAWIEQLYAEGITGGCGGGNYCPDQNVTRAEMAVLLVRTFNLTAPVAAPASEQ